MLLLQVRDMLDDSLLCGLPCIALAQWLARVLDCFGMKTAPGNILKHPGRGVEQQYVGSVNSQLNDDVGKQRCQTEMQIETEIDGAVDFNQGGQMLKMPPNPFVSALDIADIRKHHHNLSQQFVIIKLWIGVHLDPPVFFVTVAVKPHNEILQYMSRGYHLINWKLIYGHSGTVLADKVTVRVADLLVQHLLR